MKKKYNFLLLVLILIGYLVKQNIDKQGKEESKEMIKIKIEINGQNVFSYIR
mgnify:CR=1 FL=1